MLWNAQLTPAALTALLFLGSVQAAAAQTDDTRTIYPIGGIVLLAVLALLVFLALRRRRASGPPVEATESAEAPESPDKAVSEIPGTLRSTMGLMSTTVEGPLADVYFEIKESGLTIGRDAESCDVVYDLETVSRQHARLEYGPEGLVLKNLSTTNQTFLNDEPIAEAVVRSGDRIRIEETTFRVYPHRGAAERR